MKLTIATNRAEEREREKDVQVSESARREAPSEATRRSVYVRGRELYGGLVNSVSTFSHGHRAHDVRSVQSAEILFSESSKTVCVYFFARGTHEPSFRNRRKHKSTREARNKMPFRHFQAIQLSFRERYMGF